LTFRRVLGWPWSSDSTVCRPVYSTFLGAFAENVSQVDAEIHLEEGRHNEPDRIISTDPHPSFCTKTTADRIRGRLTLRQRYVRSVDMEVLHLSTNDNPYLLLLSGLVDCHYPFNYNIYFLGGYDNATDIGAIRHRDGITGAQGFSGFGFRSVRWLIKSYLHTADCT